MTGLLDAARKARSKDDLLAEIAHAWVGMTAGESCDILLRESNDGLVLRASTIFPDMTHRIRLGKGVGLCGHALLSAEPIFIASDAQKDPRFAKYPNTQDHDFESEAVLPLRNAEGRAYGVVLIRKTEAWDLTDAAKATLEELAGASSSLIDVWNNGWNAGNRANRLGALSEVTREIATSPYLEEILQLLVHLTAQQFDYRVCTVRLLDEARGELVLRATQAPAKAYQRKRAIKLGESIAGRAIDENKPQTVRDVQVEDDYIGHDLAVEQGLRSMICVPLMVQNHPVGVLTCYTSEVRDFPPDEIKALETLAQQAAVSIEHAKLQVRNTLMQEMHHRVKNNLQQVASLLRLQMSYGRYKSLEEALTDCLSRILAIANVHDLLSRDDLDQVSVKSIAESLVHTQQTSFVLPDRKIGWQVRGDDVKLNMNQATQFVLVLNELIQNSVEHGFATAREGEIHVTVKEEDEEVSVWVANSGDSLPEDFEPSQSSSLGLKIVDSLARSLGGKFKMSPVMGWTVAEVRFPRAAGE